MGQVCIPAFCNQKRCVGRILLNFLAQTVDMGFQRVCRDAGIIAPDFLKQHIAANDLVAGAIEILDDGCFLSVRRILLPFSSRSSFWPLEGVRTNDECRVFALLMLAQLRADAGKQNRERTAW